MRDRKWGFECVNGGGKAQNGADEDVLHVVGVVEQARRGHAQNGNDAQKLNGKRK